MAFFDKLLQGLEGVRKRWSEGLSGLFAGDQLNEAFWEDLEGVLIGGDVGLDLTVRFIDSLRMEAERNYITTPAALFEVFETMLVRELKEVPEMGKPLPSEKGRMTVLLLIGVNGSGKTTTAGKLASRWTKEGKKVFFAAADTFRAAAIDQLKVWGDRSGVRVIAQQQGSDAAAVTFDALQAARAAGADVLIVDTAGRLHSKHNLMEELAKIYRVLKKDQQDDQLEVLLVLDAVMGQNGLAQAERFNEVIPLTGIVLTKYDNTAKGGILLAIADRMKIPVRYVGLGEGEEDLRPFDPQEFVRALLGEKKS